MAFHHNHININITAIPMQEGNYSVTGVKRPSYLYDGLNIKQNLPPNGQQERTKSMLHQQITITFKAVAQDVVMKLPEWETLLYISASCNRFNPSTSVKTSNGE